MEDKIEEELIDFEELTSSLVVLDKEFTKNNIGRVMM